MMLYWMIRRLGLYLFFSSLLFPVCSVAEPANNPDKRWVAIVGAGPGFSNRRNELTQYRLALSKDLPWQWSLSDKWTLKTRLETSYFEWRSSLDDGDSDVSKRGEDLVHGMSLSPVWRFEYLPQWDTPIFPYFEVAVGASYITDSNIVSKNTNHTTLGCHFQFEDRIGLGSDFGSERRWGVTTYALHYSNAGTCSENSGVNFFELRLHYSF
ncbi:acyloxyacyl hydrolase [Microbulbifer sp. A4B17]|uniref:acyloxyacyl hydrolase n=1 Tax=Microbulbifer sp. A4B17 TaxID=359370 RepID=UPI0013002347|nr:acyloxyacyl hydrolase [Microbulbifer sp. A4B17]